MADGEAAARAPGVFQHPDFTATGERRAAVDLRRLETLWINTGTLCNIECAHCYIESSPANDRLVYLTPEEVAPHLDAARDMGAREIGFTGGEPFMNPGLIAMIDAAATRGMQALVLTNAMRPMQRPHMLAALETLAANHAGRIAMRVSLDHYGAAMHDRERGAGAFEASLAGLSWLAARGFPVSVAGRARWGESEDALREGYAALFAARGLAIDANDPAALVIFPEMDENAPTPEITEACWDILGKSPGDVMCASSRMLVKRKGAAAPTVIACTLLPYENEFDLGASLEASARPVKLNHPHCSKFCVLGGASCSAPAAP